MCRVSSSGGDSVDSSSLLSQSNAGARKREREKMKKKVPSHPKNYILLILTYSEDVVMQRGGFVSVVLYVVS